VFGSLLLTVVGLATFAVSALRSGVLPRPAAVLVLVGAVAFPLQSAATVLLGAGLLGLLWAGIAGLRVRPVLSDQPA
jgi:hypothetical protein